MRVVMAVGITGTRDGVDWPAVGESVDLPESEARDLIAAGHAREASVKPETATAAKPETASARKPRKAAAAKPESR